MFNFTTQTIFNNPFVVAQAEADVTPQSNLIYGTVDENGEQMPTLRIGNLRFEADTVESIEKKLPSEQILSQVTFDVSVLDTEAVKQNAAFTEGKTVTARFAFYIGLQQTSVDPYYANAMVYKGKPVYVEFPYTLGGDKWDKEQIALKKAANFVLTQGEQIMTIKVDGTKVTFTCVNGYQIIREAYLQLFDPALVAIDCCNADGGFVNIVEAEALDLVYAPKDGDTNLLTDKTAVASKTEVGKIYPGAEAFADYAWMVHNLRLPTCANYNYWSITNKMGELPAPGGYYVQYTIKVCQDRENIGGMVVGQKTHSVTTHVLYVLKDNIAALDTALATLGTIIHKADDILQTDSNAEQGDQNP